jgi:hypothetical protein
MPGSALLAYSLTKNRGTVIDVIDAGTPTSLILVSVNPAKSPDSWPKQTVRLELNNYIG